MSPASSAPLNSTPGGLLTRRCNPYGFGTDAGAKHLMGGLYGPEHVGRVKWYCTEPVAGRFRMTCEHEHRGQPMELCAGHRVMIARRQSGVCPPCMVPPRPRELYEDHQRAQAYLLEASRMPGAEQRVRALLARMDDITAALLELTCPGCMPNPVTGHVPHTPGLIHKCRLELAEVS